MKRLIAIILLCLPMQAFALKISGVEVPEKVRVASDDLLLNGAGTRTRFMFKVYVAALYLGEKKGTAEDVLVEGHAKRLSLHLLRHVDASEFMEAFRKGITANLSSEEFVPLSVRFLKFSKVFTDVGQVDKGDEITMDYLPGTGTVVSINGKERWRVEGYDFYRGLLKIWLGSKPVQDNLKKSLLGG